MEGETEDAHVNALRQRQMRNMHMALLLSQGTPMMLMGEPSAPYSTFRHPLRSACWPCQLSTWHKD